MKKSTRLFREVAAVFTLVLLVVALAAIVANFVSFVATILYAIVAFVFIGAAQRAVERSGREPEEYGMGRQERVKGLVWGLGATLVTLPFFVAGYWFWETQVHDREFEVEAENYLHWSAENDGEPAWGVDSAGVWVWSRKDKAYVGLKNHNRHNNRVVIEADEEFTPIRRGTVILKSLDGRPGTTQPSRRWSLALTHAKSRGFVEIEGPESLKVRVEPVIAGHDRWPLHQGPNAELVESGEFELDRSLWWIPLWVLTQLLLIAFPEEYFYRGYVQTRLQEAFEARAEENGRAAREFAGFTPAIVVASLLFGLGHLLVPIGGVLLATRMSVFFPSLIFGWLRRKTEGLLAPIIYHAACNLMVLFAAVHLT